MHICTQNKTTKNEKRVSVINYKMHTHLFIIIIVQHKFKNNITHVCAHLPPFIVIIMISCVYMCSEMNIRTQETHKLISLLEINAIASKKCVQVRRKNGWNMFLFFSRFCTKCLTRHEKQKGVSKGVNSFFVAFWADMLNGCMEVVWKLLKCFFENILQPYQDILSVFLYIYMDDSYN